MVDLPNATQNSTDANGESCVPMKDSDWPSLEEAVLSFADCEISSLGSSWVDARGGDEFVHEEDGFVLNLSDQSPPSWAMRAKAVATNGPAATIPVAGVTPPPLQKPYAGRQGKDAAVEAPEDAKWDLDCLEDRRLQPRFERGSAQRHRLSRGHPAKRGSV